MKKIIFFLFLPIALYSFVPSKKDKDDAYQAYEIYDRNGKKTDFATALASLEKNDIIFFGEYHNNPISHWLQLKLVQHAYETKKDKLKLSAEMFEADNQLIMDEYLAGNISSKSYEENMRLWPNYKTDYKPLVEFAKTNKLAFICANIPRRYASIVYKSGPAKLDSLNAEAKKYFAPLPMLYDGNLKCYKDMLEGSGGHGGDNLPKAQAIKDATMGHFITKNHNKGDLIIHFNGAYHSNNNEGTVWYVNQYKKDLKIGNITTVSQKETGKLEDQYKGTADFIIVVAEDMTTTH